MLRYLALVILLGLMFIMPGCGSRLKYSKTFDLTPGEIKQFSVDGSKIDQIVTLTMTSSDSPVYVCVVLKRDEAAAMDSINRDKMPAMALAKAEKTSDGTIEAKVPAKTEAIVFLWGAQKKTSVKVGIQGK